MIFRLGPKPGCGPPAWTRSTWPRPGWSNPADTSPRGSAGPPARAGRPGAQSHAGGRGRRRRGALTEVARPLLADDPVPLDLPPGTQLVVPGCDRRDLGQDQVRPGRLGRGWRRLLPMITDEPALVVIDNAIRDAVRDAELDPATALDLILAGARTAPADLLVSAMLGFAADQLAGAYCPVAVAGRPGWPGWRRRPGALVEGSAPGSDRQLAAFRMLVRTGGDVDELHRWYRNEAVPPGLEVDDELRWAIVRRLAVLDPDPGLVEDALARDPSASAVLHAARARAALGREGAKQTGLGPADARPRGRRVRAVRARRGFLRRRAGRADRGVRAALLRRDRHHRDASAPAGWSAMSRPGRTRGAPRRTARSSWRSRRWPGSCRRRTPGLVDGTDKLRRAVASLARFG